MDYTLKSVHVIVYQLCLKKKKNEEEKSPVQVHVAGVSGWVAPNSFLPRGAAFRSQDPALDLRFTVSLVKFLS